MKSLIHITENAIDRKYPNVMIVEYDDNNRVKAVYDEKNNVICERTVPDTTKLNLPFIKEFKEFAIWMPIDERYNMSSSPTNPFTCSDDIFLFGMVLNNIKEERFNEFGQVVKCVAGNQRVESEYYYSDKRIAMKSSIYNHDELLEESILNLRLNSDELYDFDYYKTVVAGEQKFHSLIYRGHISSEEFKLLDFDRYDNPDPSGRISKKFSYDENGISVEAHDGYNNHVGIATVKTQESKLCVTEDVVNTYADGRTHVVTKIYKKNRGGRPILQSLHNFEKDATNGVNTKDDWIERYEYNDDGSYAVYLNEKRRPIFIFNENDMLYCANTNELKFIVSFDNALIDALRESSVNDEDKPGELFYMKRSGNDAV